MKWRKSIYLIHIMQSMNWKHNVHNYIISHVVRWYHYDVTMTLSVSAMLFLMAFIASTNEGWRIHFKRKEFCVNFVDVIIALILHHIAISIVIELLFNWLQSFVVFKCCNWVTITSFMSISITSYWCHIECVCELQVEELSFSLNLLHYYKTNKVIKN
jgi:hypothetical protein